MKQIFLATFIVVCFCSVGSAFSAYGAEEKLKTFEYIIIPRIYVLVDTDNAPVEILSFGNGCEAFLSSFCGKVEYKNRTDRDIEAVAITIICYDVFNDEQGFNRGVSVFPTSLKGGEEDSIYLDAEVGESSVLKTAMTFVSAVRFLDGEVWKADKEEVFRIARNIPELSFLSASEMIQIERK